jgi:hypothetical protein
MDVVHSAIVSDTLKVNMLGVCISALNVPSAMELPVRAVAKGHQGYFCVTWVHGVTEAQNNISRRDYMQS